MKLLPVKTTGVTADASVVVLKGAAAKDEQNNYKAVMVALQRKYRSEHRKQLFGIELKNRPQRVGETFAKLCGRSRKACAYDICRPFDRHKIETFVYGIRDLEIKRRHEM